MANDSDLWNALQAIQLGYELARLDKKSLKMADYLPGQLKRLIQLKRFDKGTINALKRLRQHSAPARRFIQMYHNCDRIFLGRKTYRGMSDKERLRLCFQQFRAWGALASSRLAGPNSVPANAPELAKGPGVFLISQSDYDQFIDADGMIIQPIAMSYFCPHQIKQKAMDTLFSFGFGIAVPNIQAYRDHVLMLQSSTAGIPIENMEANL